MPTTTVRKTRTYKTPNYVVRKTKTLTTSIRPRKRRV